ncbi:succinate dehydrogenase cytochrome b subunit [Rhizosphaericola mali]|uniref:Succinate dehydrogenase cytochrome b subunit n=1 Tax=Rhizosphaericola mali TaxID=2545455 RepID=A0A5P2GCD6_9BACT|nr:succinate dehydrogenase cytochrome b subunit [Rhizosphaericola mali]QES89241.1 succinate dehydrogenase cytochrome b subunit [Rhizosphaericola mali]
MTWKQVFTSSVGRKLTMGLTGIFLILFLLVHAGLNACIWVNDGGVTFNRAAHFMGDNIVPRILEIGLFLFLFLHIIQGLMLEASNRGKRGVAYNVAYGNRGSKWYSRSMAILGTLVLLFLILHWYDFFIPSRFGGMPETQITTKNGTVLEVHDVFTKMKETFSQLWVVVAYIIGCLALAYHLAHGFSSAFRSVGVFNKKYNKFLLCLGYTYSVIIPLAFAMMPISIHFGWIQ